MTSLVWRALSYQIVAITHRNHVLSLGNLNYKIRRQSGKSNGNTTEKSWGRDRPWGSIRRQKLRVFTSIKKLWLSKCLMNVWEEADWSEKIICRIKRSHDGRRKISQNTQWKKPGLSDYLHHVNGGALEVKKTHKVLLLLLLLKQWGESYVAPGWFKDSFLRFCCITVVARSSVSIT